MQHDPATVNVVNNPCGRMKMIGGYLEADMTGSGRSLMSDIIPTSLCKESRTLQTE